jgi:hypothetical protein
MCVAPAAIPAVTLAISAVSTAASIGMGVYSANQQSQQAQAQMNMAARQQQLQQDQQRQSAIQQQEQLRVSQTLQLKQAQERANLDVQQSNQSILTQYEQQVRATRNERESIMSRFSVDKLAYQRSKEQADKQYGLNNEALNTAYVQEQVKLTEVRRKASFEAQAALAKSIGMKGKILASGRTGQSVGLLVKDVERQSGFKKAQAAASVESAAQAASVGMQAAQNQADSANTKAANGIGFNPEKPYLPEMPGSPNFVDPIGLAIPVEVT